MREITGYEKKEYIKFINKELYGNPKYDEYFLGEPLTTYDIMKITSDRNYIMCYSWYQAEQCYNVDYLRLSEINTGTIKECLDDFERMAKIHILKCNANIENKAPFKFLRKLAKRHIDKIIDYYIGHTYYVYFFPYTPVRNVLTIDLDFMFKDMHKFQRYMNCDVSPKLSWKLVEAGLRKDYKMGLGDCLPDIEAVKFINSVLKDKCKGADRVKIMEHDEILQVMKSHGCLKADVWNVDSHHDCGGYNPEKDYELSIENWVKHGRNNNLIKDYDWICREMNIAPYGLTFKVKGTCFKDLKWQDIPHFDLVVICVSKHFTPPKWWYVADNLIKL